MQGQTDQLHIPDDVQKLNDSVFGLEQLDTREDLDELPIDLFYELEKRTNSERKDNSPHMVRKSFQQYLQHRYMYQGTDGEDWTHPLKDENGNDIIFKHKEIKAALTIYKVLNPENYLRLWALWTSKASRNFIADNFHLSHSSLRRRWDEAIDIVILILMFPELHPEMPLVLFDNRT